MTNTTTLNLAERVAKLGSSINTRTEKHGDEDVPACDIPLEGIMLEAAELDALLGKGAHKALFRDKELSEPRFEALKDFAMRDKFVGDVALDLPDLRLELDGENVVLSAIKLEPKVGGFTAMSLQVQCTPSAEEIAALVSSLNRGIRAAITFGGRKTPSKKKQRELPMPHPGANGESDEDAATTSTH